METVINAVCGGAAGMAVDSVLFPLDTIKTRLQARRAAVAASGTASTAASTAAAAATGAPAARSFYRGLLSAMLGSAPAAATFWTVYEASKAALLPRVGGGEWSWVAYAASAGAADVMVTAVRNPFEVVKQQLQAGLHRTTAEAVSTILRVDGWRGLYAGYFSTVAREIPFDAVEFALYEQLKSARATAVGRELHWWENAGLGSVAGGVAAAVTTPLDVIKTRLMTQTRTAVHDRYTGWGDAARRIVVEEGAGALFAGIRPRVAWISVGGAIFIGTFEELKRRATAAFPPSSRALE